MKANKSRINYPFKLHIKIFFRWFFLVIGMFASLFIVLYASLSIASTRYSLPGLKFNGKNVGLRKINEISKIVDSERNNLKAQRLSFQLDNESAQKSLNELGVSIDVPLSTKRIFDFGKTEDIFPTYSYIASLLRSDLRIKPYIVKSNDFENHVQQIFNQKIDPQNASLVLNDGKLQITAEVNGYKVDTNDLKRSVEERLASRDFSKVIIAKKITVKSNIISSDLITYQSKVQTLISNKIYFQGNNKKIYPKDADLLSFVDQERTVLSQSVTLADSAIDTYLSSIEKQIDIVGTKKKISSLDNSILDEGREGKKLDIAKSRENIKNALLANAKLAMLEITTAPIQEEVISPGYNPGKYPGKYIEVNLSQQMLYAFEGSNLIKTYKVSTGKWSMPTPEGEFSINNKVARAYSSSYDLYMPYWMAFIGSEYGIHELPEWADGTKEGESHLGTPVSHGCVRLGRGSAEDVYNWAETGTIVFIHK